MHMIDLVKRLAELDAGNPNVIKEESGSVSCSSCGDKFKIAGRKDGFSHCKDHAGHKALDESVSLEECGPMGMMAGGMDHHTPASINITADSGDELSTMLRDIMTLAGRGHAEPDADNMPVDAVAVDMTPPAEVSMDGGDDENGLMRSMMDKLNSTGDEEETDESDNRVYDNSPDEETEDYSALTRHGDLNKNSVQQGDRMDGNMPKGHATMEERLMADWKQFMTESSGDSLSFWKQEAQKAGGAKNIDWYSIGVEHGKQGIVMNPPYGAGGRAVAQYDKGLEAGENFDPLKHVDNPTQGEKDAAPDVDRGSYSDRSAMLRSAQQSGRLKDTMEGDSGAQYRVKSRGHDAQGPFYIDPKTGKKVRGDAKVGDHVNPKTGKVTPKV